MFTTADKQSPPDAGYNLPVPEPTRSSPLTSEAVLNRGYWRTRDVAVASRDASKRSEALEWRPSTSLGQRITRAVSVPALAGGVVFVLAVIIAITVTVIQSGSSVDAAAVSATGEKPLDSNLREVTSPQGNDPANAADTADKTSAPKTVLVHVVGEVEKPGIVKLSEGDRVTEAIAAAGGATATAVLEAVNIARVVTDGEQILIPNAEQAAAGAQVVSPQGAAESANPSGPASNALVNINSADVTLLETLPRIGPALAQRILDWRQEKGPFLSIDQLTDVPGVGPKIFEGLREKVTV